MEGDKEVKLLSGGNVVLFEKNGSLNTYSGQFNFNKVKTENIEGKWIMLTKGAPDVLLDRASRVITEDSVINLDDNIKKIILIYKNRGKMTFFVLF